MPNSLVSTQVSAPIPTHIATEDELLDLMRKLSDTLENNEEIDPQAIKEMISNFILVEEDAILNLQRDDNIAVELEDKYPRLVSLSEYILLSDYWNTAESSVLYENAFDLFCNIYVIRIDNDLDAIKEKEQAEIFERDLKFLINPDSHGNEKMELLRQRLLLQKKTGNKQQFSALEKIKIYSEETNAMAKELKFPENLRFVQGSSLEIGMKIGSGSYADVHMANYQEEKVALKIQRIVYALRCVLSFFKEASILKEMDHPNVMSLLYVTSVKHEGDMKHAIVMPLMKNGTLLEYILKNFMEFSCFSYINIMLGVARGMNYLHENDLLHRDFKEHNVFIDEFGCPKIGDFGTLVKTTDGKYCDFSREVVTTLAYVSENLRKQSGRIEITYVFADDVYSFGMILLGLLYRQPAYELWSIPAFQDNKTTALDACQTNPLSIFFRPLIECCWENDPAKQSSMTNIVDSLEQMLPNAPKMPIIGSLSPR